MREPQRKGKPTRADWTAVRPTERVIQCPPRDSPSGDPALAMALLRMCRFYRERCPHPSL